MQQFVNSLRMISMMNETEVIQAVIRGDIELFGELIERYHVGLVIHCRRIIGDDADGEDCAQQAFIKAYEHLASFDAERGKFSTWLYRIATNVCRDMLRKQKRRVLADDIDAFAEAFTPDVFLQESIREVRQAVKNLVPPSHQRVIVAYYWEGKTYQGIADEMNVSINTVKSWIRRARQQLREELAYER